MTPHYGIRALARLLITYQSRYGLSTIRQLISRWAPPADDNPTSSYVDFVSRQTGWQPDQTLAINRASVLVPLSEAIIAFENGQQPYSQDTISTAVKAAIA